MTGQHEKYEKRVNCVVFFFFLNNAYFLICNSGIADNPKSPLIVLLEDLSNAGKSGETTEVRYDRRQSWQKLLRTMREDKKTCRKNIYKFFYVRKF